MSQTTPDQLRQVPPINFKSVLQTRLHDDCDSCEAEHKLMVHPSDSIPGSASYIQCAGRQCSSPLRSRPRLREYHHPILAWGGGRIQRSILTINWSQTVGSRRIVSVILTLFGCTVELSKPSTINLKKNYIFHTQGISPHASFLPNDV